MHPKSDQESFILIGTEQNRLYLPNQNTAVMNKKIANINGRLPEEQTVHQSWPP